MSRERSMGKGASQRAGIGRVRIATFSASCLRLHRSRHQMHGSCFNRRHNDPTLPGLTCSRP